jgi:hypothetical protein
MSPSETLLNVLSFSCVMVRSFFPLRRRLGLVSWDGASWNFPLWKPRYDRIDLEDGQFGYRSYAVEELKKENGAVGLYVASERIGDIIGVPSSSWRCLDDTLPLEVMSSKKYGVGEKVELKGDLFEGSGAYGGTEIVLRLRGRDEILFVMKMEEGRAVLQHVV